jgi:hypothetical protein
MAGLHRDQGVRYRKRLGEEGIIKREGPRDDKEGTSLMRRRISIDVILGILLNIF